MVTGLLSQSIVFCRGLGSFSSFKRAWSDCARGRFLGARWRKGLKGQNSHTTAHSVRSDVQNIMRCHLLTIWCLLMPGLRLCAYGLAHPLGFASDRKTASSGQHTISRYILGFDSLNDHAGIPEQVCNPQRAASTTSPTNTIALHTLYTVLALVSAIATFLMP